MSEDSLRHLLDEFGGPPPNVGRSDSIPKLLEDVAALRNWIESSPAVEQLPWRGDFVVGSMLDDGVGLQPGLGDLVSVELQSLLSAAVRLGRTELPEHKALDPLGIMASLNGIELWAAAHGNGGESKDIKNPKEPIWSGTRTPAEWCKHFGISKKTLDRRIKDGTLVVEKVDKSHWRFTLESIARYERSI